MNILGLAVGAFIGTLLRYGLGNLIPPAADGFPLSILLINLAGCLFLGWFSTIVLLHWNLPQYVRLGIGTGLTGSFTTFSTFSLDSVKLMENGQGLTAFVYLAVSVVGGIALAGAGFGLARAQAGRRKGQA